MLHIRFCRFAEGNGFRIIRVHATGAERLDGFHIQQRAEFFIGDDFNFLDFVRRPEPIEEIEDRNTTGNSRSMDNGGQIHNFLYARFTHHADARATHSHSIIMTGKNSITIGSNRTGRYMEYTRQEFAGNLEHVGKHDHHALGRSKGRRQRTSIQCAVHCTGCPFFRLHFLYLDRRPEQVLPSMGCPFIYVFSHRG